MNKHKILLIVMVFIISSICTVFTMYFYGSWQHDRYWNGTIVRVNEIESSIYIKLLSVDIKDIYTNRDFDKLKPIFKPLENKLLIRITDNNKEIVFENAENNRELGEMQQETQIETDTGKFSIQIFRYRPVTWNSVYMGWFSHYSEWFSIKYDRITIPAIFYFLIWSLFITAAIWRHKANIENDRLFHVLKEFKVNCNEDKLD